MPAISSSSTDSMRLNRFPARRILPAKGRRRTPHSTSGNLRPGLPFASRLSVADGNWTVRAIPLSGVLAGNDHEVSVSCVHDDGVMTAVAPVGIPLTVNVTGVGNTVPAVGTMVSEYVAD